MATFLQKLRVVTLGTVHDLLDKEIDMNSPSALRQYVRDLEDALSQMKSSAAIQDGQIRTYTREKDDLTHRIEAAKIVVTNSIKTGASQDVLRVKAAAIVNLQKDLERTIKNLESQKLTSAAADEALAKTEAKHADMVARVRELERLDRDTKSKEQSASTMESANALVNMGSDISVDDVESKMRARNDVASAKFDRAMGSFKVEEDPETSSQVDDLLASLQPKDEVKKA